MARDKEGQGNAHKALNLKYTNVAHRAQKCFHYTTSCSTLISPDTHFVGCSSTCQLRCSHLRACNLSRNTCNCAATGVTISLCACRHRNDDRTCSTPCICFSKAAYRKSCSLVNAVLPVPSDRVCSAGHVVRHCKSSASHLPRASTHTASMPSKCSCSRCCSPAQLCSNAWGAVSVTQI